MPDDLPVIVRPLTPSRWADLESVFESRGCSIARGCWCMFYRETGPQALPPGVRLPEVRRRRLKALCDTGPPPGLLAYAGPRAVGWMTLGPRAAFLKLQHSPVMKRVDDAPVWSIVCFVVPAEFRQRGIARALLRGGIEFASKRGVRILEAYPIDKPERGRDDSMWHGALSMFEAAGFREVARRRPHRPVVRLELLTAR